MLADAAGRGKSRPSKGLLRREHGRERMSAGAPAASWPSRAIARWPSRSQEHDRLRRDAFLAPHKAKFFGCRRFDADDVNVHAHGLGG